MRELLNVDGEDSEQIVMAQARLEGLTPLVVEHRLSILRDLNKNEPDLEPLSDLYASLKTKKDGVHRSHLSRKRKSENHNSAPHIPMLMSAEMEERATKREARIAKSQAKAEKSRAQAVESAKNRDDDRPTKRRRKADIA